MTIRIYKPRAYLSFYLFLLIFMPPFIPKINFLYVLDVLAFISLFTKYKNTFANIAQNELVKKFNVSFWTFTLVAIIYSIIDMTAINRLEANEYIVNIYRLVGVGLLIQVPVLYVVCYCYDQGLTFEDLLKCVVNAGLMQAVIAVLMLLSPTIKTALNNIFISNVFGSFENANLPYWTFNERLYGFANVLFDGFGYGTGIIAGIAFILLFLSPSVSSVIRFALLLIVPAVNAITGVFIVAMAAVSKFLSSLKNKKFKRTSLAIFAGIVVVGVISILFISRRSGAAFIRLQSNFQAILKKKTITSTTSYNNLFRKSYWVLPDSFMHVLFGTGHTVYTSKAFDHSDVGYINMIWFVGIVGCIWMYGSFIKMGIRAKDYLSSETNKCIILFLMLSFLLFEIKGIGVAINTGIPIIMLLCYGACALIEKNEQISE